MTFITLLPCSLLSILHSRDNKFRLSTFNRVTVRVQDLHVPVRVKDPKAGSNKEPWMSRGNEALVRKKKKSWIRCRQLGSGVSLEEYRARKSKNKKETRTKPGQELALVDKVKGKAKDLKNIIKG